jgi:hypothetical protein
MDGIATYFEKYKYTDPTTDPTALASGSTASSAAIDQSQRVQRPAFGDSAMAPPPTELHGITTGASTAASTAASGKCGAGIRCKYDHLGGNRPIAARSAPCVW